MSNDGLMAIQFTNTGFVVSEFFISVRNCTNGIQHVPGHQISLQPQRSHTSDFQIYTEYEKGKLHLCEAELRDSLGNIVDSKTVNFTTTDKVIKSKQDNEHNNQTVSDAEEIREDEQTKEDLDCDDYCPNWYDLLCSITHVLTTIYIYIYI